MTPERFLTELQENTSQHGVSKQWESAMTPYQLANVRADRKQQQQQSGLNTGLSIKPEHTISDTQPFRARGRRAIVDRMSQG